MPAPVPVRLPAGSHRDVWSNAADSHPVPAANPFIYEGPPRRKVHGVAGGHGFVLCGAIRGRISIDWRAFIDQKPRMPKKPGTNPKGEFAFFDVVYEDDSLRSNRRVPTELLGGLEGDEPARAFIHAQDQEIAEKGGRPALEIKSISRVGAKKKKAQGQQG